MQRILEPEVTSLQGLIVPSFGVTLGSMMEDSELLAFAARLNQLCDDMGVPPKGSARQTNLAKIFDVSQKGSRKWLEAEGYPTLAMCKRIALWAGVQVEWLLTGRGTRQIIEYSTNAATAHSACEPLPGNALSPSALSPGKRHLFNAVQQAVGNPAFDDTRARLVADLIAALLTPPKRND